MTTLTEELAWFGPTVHEQADAMLAREVLRGMPAPKVVLWLNRQSGTVGAMPADSLAASTRPHITEKTTSLTKLVELCEAMTPKQLLVVVIETDGRMRIHTCEWEGSAVSL